jgi:hypothetical protein
MKIKKETKQEEINSIKNPRYTIDPELNKYAKLSLFPEKVKKAKAHLAKVGMPKEYYEQIARENEEKQG